MNFSATTGTATFVGIMLVCAGLVVALCVSRLDLSVVRRDLADLAAEREQLIGERDQATKRVIEIRTAMSQQRANTNALLARIRHLEAGGEAVALTRPATPLPIDFVVDHLMTEIETHLGKKGGELR